MKTFQQQQIDNAPAEALFIREWLPEWFWTLGMTIMGDRWTTNRLSRWIFFREMTAREQMDLYGDDK